MPDSLDLTIERMFAEPPLTGPLPSRVRFSASGRFLTWLIMDPDADTPESALCVHEVERGATTWIRQRDLKDSGAELTEAEKARRERQRIFRGGIVEYQSLPGRDAVLIALDGQLFERGLVDGVVVRWTPEEHRAIAPTPRPGGGIAWIHDDDLWFRPSPEAPVRRLTDDGGDGITNGLAEFIAAEEMHRFEGHWWSPCGRRIAYTRVDETPIPLTHRVDVSADRVTTIAQRYPYAGGPNATVELWVADLESGERQRIDWGAGGDDWHYLARVLWRPDGQALLLKRQTRLQNALELVEVALDGRIESRLTERSDTWINLHENPHVLADGSLVWLTESTPLARLQHLAGTDRRDLTPSDLMVTEVIDIRDDTVWFRGWQERPTSRHLYSVLLHGDEPPVRHTEGDAVHDIVLGPEPSLRAELVSAPAHPTSLRLVTAAGIRWLVDNRPTGSHPMTPYMPARRTATIDCMPAADGQTLWYRLTLPAGERPPLIVHVYGGPGVQRVFDDWQPSWPQLLAARGYAVLELDNRGSSGRGRAFEAPIHHRMGTVEVDDQVAGVRHLIERGLVDPERIGVMGHSYGGYLTLRCLQRAPELFRAGVSIAPVTDWALYDTHYTERYMGLPSQQPDAYRHSGVFEDLERFHDRLLIIHGMADDNVLFTHSTQLFHALQQRRVAFEMMTYPGEKHGLATPSTAIHRFTQTLAFFDRRLKA